jgi:hypothetical protein
MSQNLCGLGMKDTALVPRFALVIWIGLMLSELDLTVSMTDGDETAVLSQCRHEKCHWSDAA